MKKGKVLLKIHFWKGVDNFGPLRHLKTSAENIDKIKQVLQSRFNNCCLNLVFNELFVLVLIIIILMAYTCSGVLLWDRRIKDDERHRMLFLITPAGLCVVFLILILGTCFIEKYKLKSSQRVLLKETDGIIRIVPVYSKKKKRNRTNCFNKRYLKSIKIKIHVKESLKLNASNAKVEQCKLNQPSWDSSIVVNPKSALDPKLLPQNVSSLSLTTHNRNSISRSPRESSMMNTSTFNHSFSDNNIKINEFDNGEVRTNSLRFIQVVSKAKRFVKDSPQNCLCKKIKLEY